MSNKINVYVTVKNSAKIETNHLNESSLNDEEQYCGEHLVVEMATFGQGKWGKSTYKVAVHGGYAKDREIPHIHIYLANEYNIANSVFNFEISLLDILTKNELNIIFQLDQSANIQHTNRNECSWKGYHDLYKGFMTFLLSKPISSRKSGNFKDNLDRAIHEWNRETDLNGYENLGKNPLKEYIERKNLTILPQYMKYFEQE